VRAPRNLIPWLLVIAAVPFVFLGLEASSQSPACGELPGAFGKPVRTEQSETLGGYVATHCETTRIKGGAVASKTVINWSGLAAGAALLVGAWFLGAALVGQVSRRSAWSGMAVSSAVILIALATLFI